MLNLPVTHTTPSLSDISDGSTSVSNSSLGLKEGSSFLTLDCSAVAKALSALPLYQLLDIDPELTGESENVPPSQPDSVGPQSSSNPVSRDLVSSRGTSEGDVLGLSQSLKRMALKEGAGSEGDAGMCSTSPQQSRKVNNLLTKELPLTDTISADEDKKLDSLLSTSEAKPPNCGQTRTSTDKQAPVITTGTAIAADKSHPPPTVSGCEDETSELDDMLDELLA